MGTYRTVIGAMGDDGRLLVASSRNCEHLDLAEELAEHWANRILGTVHDSVGIMNYVAVQVLAANSEWQTLTELEH